MDHFSERMMDKLHPVCIYAAHRNQTILKYICHQKIIFCAWQEFFNPTQIWIKILKKPNFKNNKYVLGARHRFSRKLCKITNKTVQVMTTNISGPPFEKQLNFYLLENKE